MSRLSLLIALLALAFAAPASAAETFLGVTTEGAWTTFNTQVPTQLRPPKKVRGVARGDRIVALATGYALGRTGRIYRFDQQARRATATPIRLSLTGKSFSIIPTAPNTVRVLGDQGFDTTVDLTTGLVTQGAGFKLLGSDVAVSGVWALRADGRMSGISPARATLLTETAPGSGVVTEVKLDPSSSSPYARVRFATPLGYTIASGTGYLVSGLPELRRPQSSLIRVDLETGDVAGESGPFFYRAFTAILPDGSVPEDTRPPKVTRVIVPRVVSLRDLRVNNRVKVAVRCSEACIVQAGTAIGGRSNISMTGTRDTPGTVRFGLFGLRGRAYELMKARVGKTALFRIRVQDWYRNSTTVERTFRLTR